MYFNKHDTPPKDWPNHTKRIIELAKDKPTPVRCTNDLKLVRQAKEHSSMS